MDAAFIDRRKETHAGFATLRRRGMKYWGSVTVYAHLQASGVINDHEPGCWRGRQLRERYEYSICEGA